MNTLAEYVTQSTRFSRKPNGPPVLRQVDELNEPDAEACCEEMQALLDYANYLFEMAKDPEEYDALVLDDLHVEVRREIADHKCLDPITRDLLAAAEAKNPALAAKFRAALK